MKKVKNKKVLTFEITLAGISAGLSVVFIVVAYYFGIGVLALYALAGFCLCLPIYVESLRGTVFAYVAASLISFLATGFNYVFVMPFILLFGPHIIISALCGKYLRKKWYFSIPIKLAFFNLALFAIFEICGLNSIYQIMERVGMSARYLWVALIGSPLFIVYDYLIQGVYGFFGRRLYKVFDKYRPKKQNSKNFVSTDNTNNNDNTIPENTSKDNNDNPFDEF